MLYVPLFILLLMVLFKCGIQICRPCSGSPFRFYMQSPFRSSSLTGLHENETLVSVIWIALISLVILSWIVTIRKENQAQT